MVIDPLEDYPGYALRRASAANMARLARRFAVLDLRAAEASVLMVIDANPNVRQSEIGRLLDIASANMAPLVSRLADRELVDRQPVDGRSHGLALTSTGRDVVAKLKKVMAAHEAELMSKIPAAQHKSFLAALRKLWREG
jgi:DNA-binding MarR family transcriptional regulator